MKRFSLLIAASAVAGALAVPTFAQTSGSMGASPGTGPRPSEQSPTDGRAGGTGPLATPPANDPGPVQRPGGPTSSNPTPSDQMVRPERPTGNAVEQSKTDGRSGGTGPMSGQPTPQHDASTIREVQQALQGKGFDVGPIDGVMGPRTAAALREFQQQRGLNGSGRLDRETLSALNVRTGS
jgi:hypothetical protein